MRVIEQSIAATVVFLMVDSTSHITGINGVTPAVKLSKAGGAGATATGAVTAVDATNNPGWYKITLSTTETNTLGDLVLSATATGADPTDRLLVVELATLSNVDTEVDAIKAKTDNLPASPAAVGSNMGTVVSVTSGVTLASNQDIRNITGTLPNVTLAATQGSYAPAKAGDAMNLTSAYDAAKTAASQASVSAIPTDPLLASDARLNNLDTTISSRNATDPPTVAAIDAALSAAHGVGSWVDSGATNLAGIATAANVTASQAAVIAAMPAAPPTAAAIDTQLSATHGAGLWLAGGGGGYTAVDHNTGGTDNLRYTTAAGVGIDNGSIMAYVATAYAAGDFSNPVGATTTNSDGRWSAPLLLDAGVAYTLIFYKQGGYQITTVEVTP